ncbi:histidine--tRNA ligase [Candidatus Woesearchaeota archaeon]|nr:histidine--tRNA ligase [Candidatus Woesearchaeota archaeon]
MTLQTAKGTRDFPAEQAIARQRIAGALKRIFEIYGYSPLETPLIERYDVLAAKYAGGAEILKETFKLTDQGGRELALRYDLTVPMCRYLAMNPNLKMPFKRYQMGEVFRDGPIKLGRYRQFTQCDVDIVGAASMKADAEIVSIAQSAFRELGLDVKIKINSRKVLNGILDTAKVKESLAEPAILALDKLEKFGVEEVRKELKEKKISAESIKAIEGLVAVKGSNEKKIEQLRKSMKSKQGEEGLREMEELLANMVDTSNVIFEPSLARGLAYYTGPVFEAFPIDSEVKSSLAGGGRYDKLIGNFLGEKKEYPAVGISFGLDAISEAAKAALSAKTSAKLYVIPIKNYTAAAKIAAQFREQGIATDIDLLDRSVGKNLEYASAMGIPFVAIIGGQEIGQGKVKLRNMRTGEEALLGAKEAAERIK